MITQRTKLMSSEVGDNWRHSRCPGTETRVLAGGLVLALTSFKISTRSGTHRGSSFSSTTRSCWPVSVIGSEQHRSKYCSTFLNNLNIHDDSTLQSQLRFLTFEVRTWKKLHKLHFSRLMKRVKLPTCVPSIITTEDDIKFSLSWRYRRLAGLKHPRSRVQYDRLEQD